MRLSTFLPCVFSGIAHGYLDFYGLTTQTVGGAGGTQQYGSYAVTDSTQSSVCQGKSQGGFHDGVNNYCDTHILCNNGNVVQMADGPCTGDAETPNGSFYSQLFSVSQGNSMCNLVGSCTWNYNPDGGTCATAGAASGATLLIKCDTTYC